MKPYWYLNGKVKRADELGLPLNDLGLLRGYGVFDFLRTHGGKPFLLREHLDRFFRSAKMLDLTMPVSRRELERTITLLLKKNHFKESIVRPIITGGASVDGITLGAKPSLLILVVPAHEQPKERYTKGIALKTIEYQRLLPEVKTLNYILAVKHQKGLKRAGAYELLFISEGKVLECSSSNVFIVKKGTLITPKKNILVGTTRNFVIRIARKEYEVAERDVKVSELWSADEVFITASNKAVMPVARIDGRRIGNGRVGPVARRLLQLYEEAVH